MQRVSECHTPASASVQLHQARPGLGLWDSSHSRSLDQGKPWQGCDHLANLCTTSLLPELGHSLWELLKPGMKPVSLMRKRVPLP